MQNEATLRKISDMPSTKILSALRFGSKSQDLKRFCDSTCFVVYECACGRFQISLSVTGIFLGISFVGINLCSRQRSSPPFKTTEKTPPTTTNCPTSLISNSTETLINSFGLLFVQPVILLYNTGIQLSGKLVHLPTSNPN